MSIQEHFSEDYFSAREKFLLACRSAGLETITYEHPETGPGGESLATDSVYVGRADAKNLLVLISGVHGVEALCGSACQAGWLAEGSPNRLPGETAVLLIHAINCWGAAHLRRNTDGNVDLCRNFMDFDDTLPARPEYEEIHVAISCPEYRGPMRDAANMTLRGFREKHGMDSFVAALMGGQYRHPDGFSYGGDAPTWSNRVVSQILSTHGQQASRVVLIEYHSGLGPYGYGTAVTMHTGDDLDRARNVFGNWILAPNERGPETPRSFYTAHGHTTEGYRNILGSAEITSVVLEYGTYPPQRSLGVMLDDHWLTHFGDRDSEVGKAIKAELLELHHPKSEEWRRAIWDRSTQIIRQAMSGFG